MSFADTIRAERDRLGLTQAACAMLLDISPRTVWAWEKGSPPSKIEEAGALAILRKLKGKK